MEILEVEVRVGITKNLGNYESARLDYGYRVTVDPSESVKEVRQLTLAHLKEEVLQDIGKVAP